MVRVRCVPGLHVPPAVGTLDVAGGEAQQVGEVGVEGPGVDGGVLRGRHAGGRAQWRQVERRADGWLQSGLGILNWDLISHWSVSGDLISHWSVSGVASLAIFCNKEQDQTMVLYGMREPIIGPFRAWKPTILMP